MTHTNGRHFYQPSKRFQQPIIDRLMAARELTVADIARLTGLDHKTVQRSIDPKKTRVTVDNLRKIASVLGCRTGDLIDEAPHTLLIGTGNDYFDDAITEYRLAVHRFYVDGDIERFSGHVTPEWKFIQGAAPWWDEWARAWPEAKQWQQDALAGLTISEIPKYMEAHNRFIAVSEFDFNLTDSIQYTPVNDHQVLSQGCCEVRHQARPTVADIYTGILTFTKPWQEFKRGGRLNISQQINTFSIQDKLVWRPSSPIVPIESEMYK